MSKPTSVNETWATLAPVIDAHGKQSKAKEQNANTFDVVRPPPRIGKEAFECNNGVTPYPSFITDIVQLACHNSEASPEAVALNVVVFFSALVGREKLIYKWGDTFIDARPSVLIVGKSGSNKGISEHLVKRIFSDFEELMKKRDKDFMPLDTRSGGLNSGEGLIHSLRDEVEGEGVNDKRALIIEPEFSKVLAVSGREGTTLSATLRNFHDGIDQRNTTRNAASECTKPHLVMMCHITKEELLKKIKSDDIANGLINRFMIFHTSQIKDVANPTPAPKDQVQAVVNHLVEIMDFVNEGQTMIEADDFLAKFDSIYSELRHPKGTLQTQQLLARRCKYVRMLSMIFAVMEKQTLINEKHLNMALIYVKYWGESVSYIFDSEVQTVQHEKIKELSQKVLDAIIEIHNESGRCTKTDIARYFNSNVPSKEMNAALSVLLETVPPKIKQEKGVRTNGGVAPKLYEPVL